MKRALVSVTNKDGIVEFCLGLEKLGFEIEQFGNLSFIINSIPSVLANIDLNKFFNNFFLI